MPIKTVESAWPDAPEGWSTQDWKALPAAERGLWQVQDTLVRLGHPMPSGLDAEHPVYARLDHSRWIVQCPECSSAQLAATSDPRFYCIECANNATGLWRPVLWPEDRPAVETAALARSGPTMWAHASDRAPAARHVRQQIDPPRRPDRPPRPDRQPPQGR
ncbi:MULTISPECIES: hypothetical protein [unclassified Crossiella]|uniref:hypothetical protein n=1 Tax=unclassified Crossiella TaxID=2620835 RepID=UPI0020001683|nr:MULTISPECIES: hypothetical protein [unclassified Crossiella]MCK2242140.1 hypothetical protein [Crossiella sp. S99.2]MCK2256043.1 hypothetical protein [Crossiella sp. S99.1]